MTTTDQVDIILEQLRLGKNEAFEYLYKKHYHTTEAYVKSNAGTVQDARDIFQEALLVLFKKTHDADFRLTSDLGSYIQAIVRNMWLYRLRTRRAHPEVPIDEPGRLPDVEDDHLGLILNEQAQEEKHIAVKQLLETLKTDCQKLIEYVYYYQFSSTQIAELLGYAESFVKVKKHRCMEALREKVKNHPAFNDEK
jgi:RNA polymerase sigma factor (sigma-70 family)